MKTGIRNLEAAGVDEDTIVEHLNTTHLEVRRKLRKPVEALTLSCRAEVQLTDDYETANKVMARQYRTSETEIYKARYLTLPRKLVPTKEQVLMIWHEGYNTVKEVAQQLNSQERPVRTILEAEGLANPPRQSTTTRGVRPAMLAEIMKGLTYADVAKQFDCSESTISNLAISQGYGRQEQRKNMDNWPEILEYAAEHNVSEAARKYNVERSNIYYHRNKEA
tara:strand:- start:40334 stop:40999 length:666 start_codon:yes stop_codon:yes gene_type:complete